MRYLYLVNWTPVGPVRTKASVITEEIPVYDLEVLTRFPVKKAILQPNGKELGIKIEKDGARIIIPRVNVHNIVELQ